MYVYVQWMHRQSVVSDVYCIQVWVCMKDEIVDTSESQRVFSDCVEDSGLVSFTNMMAYG